MQEMLEIESFDEDTVNELRTRAKDALLTMEHRQARGTAARSRRTCSDFDGLTPELIAKLEAGGVHSRDELADLAVDELIEITGIDAEAAKDLIMKAREHWFAAEAAAQENARRRSASRRPGRHARRRPRKDRHTYGIDHRRPTRRRAQSPAAALLEQLKSAGVSKASTDDSVTESDKARLLDHLRTAHGTVASAERKKITLTRKSTSEIKQADSSGKARTIQVEVRKKRTFVKRDEVAGRRPTTPRRGRAHEAELRRREEEAHAEAERLRVQEEELAAQRRQREEQERAEREAAEARAGAARARQAAEAAAAAAAAARAPKPPRPARPRRGERAAAEPSRPRQPKRRRAGQAGACASSRRARSRTRKSSAPPTWPSAARPPKTRPPPSAR